MATIFQCKAFSQHLFFKKNSMTKKSYQPISCDFHSELELRALRRKPVEIRYRNDEGTEVSVTAEIADLYTRNSEEFLLLPDGHEIRLDHLVSVDGLELKNFYC